MQQLAYDAAPQAARCERCGRGPETGLRFVSLHNGTRSVERTLCETCSEALAEFMLETEPGVDAAAR